MDRLLKINPFKLWMLFVLIIFVHSWSNAQFVSQGTEIQANTYFQSEQKYSDVASDYQGNYVVVWQSLDQLPNPDYLDNYNIYAQRFNSMGVRLGNEIRVSVDPYIEHSNPAVAMDSAGNFVIVWQTMVPGNAYDIYAQRYSNTGLAIDYEIVVNSIVQGSQTNPDVAMDKKGNYTICWKSNTTLYAKKYLNTRFAVGNEFVVNEILATYDCDSPSIAMDSTGKFIIGWNYITSANYALGGIYARRFDALGNPLDHEFKVQTSGGYYQSGPSLALSNNGSFVIAWNAYTNSIDFEDAYARMYDASGTPLANEFIMNTYKDLYQRESIVASNNDGSFLAAWVGSFGEIKGQLFDESGNKTGLEFLVNNTNPTSNCYYPNIISDSKHNYVITYTNFNGKDGNGKGVFVNQYGVNSIPTINNTTSTFQIDENTTIGDALCTIIASDADISQSLKYEFLSGNDNGTFSINNTTGEIILIKNIDYEVYTTFPLLIRVSDNGDPAKYVETLLTVNINDINEFTPVLLPKNFSINADLQNGNVVGSSAANDGDILQVLSYSILGGNVNNAFIIDNLNGLIKVNNALSLQSVKSYDLVVEVSDNGTPAKTTSATIHISVGDPTAIYSIQKKSFSIFPNPANDYLNIDAQYPSSVQITDLSGVILAETYVEKGILEVSAIHPGVYLLIVTDQNQQKTIEKLVVE